MKQKKDRISTSKLLKYALFGFVTFLGLLGLYYSSASAPGLRRSDEDSSVRSVGVFSRNRDFDEMFEDQELNPEVPKSLPVSSSCVSIFEL